MWKIRCKDFCFECVRVIVFKIMLVKLKIKVGLCMFFELRVKCCSLISFHVLSTFTLCLARVKCRVR